MVFSAYICSYQATFIYSFVLKMSLVLLNMSLWLKTFFSGPF